MVQITFIFAFIFAATVLAWQDPAASRVLHLQHESRRSSPLSSPLPTLLHATFPIAYASSAGARESALLESSELMASLREVPTFQACFPSDCSGRHNVVAHEGEEIGVSCTIGNEKFNCFCDVVMPMGLYTCEGQVPLNNDHTLTDTSCGRVGACDSEQPQQAALVAMIHEEANLSVAVGQIEHVASEIGGNLSVFLGGVAAEKAQALLMRKTREVRVGQWLRGRFR